jgi:ATP-grasp ribosomal peptide maturase
MAAVSGGAGWSGWLWAEGVRVDLACVGAVYYRRPTRFRLPDGLSDGDAVFAAAEARLGLGGVLTGLDARWVNDPARVAVAEYKPRQLAAAGRFGLRVPRTLVTNDYDAAVAFAAEVDGPVVCKTLSSLVLAEDGQPRITYTTTLVDPAAVDPGQLAATAHLLQEWVPKAFEVRVTMVGSRALAVAIHAGSGRGRVDWRAGYRDLRYEPVEVPPPVAAGMVGYLGAFGLAYGAFDFVVTPAGEWIMLECNPAGQWLWLAQETGLPVAAALAGLLAAGDPR